MRSWTHGGRYRSEHHGAAGHRARQRTAWLHRCLGRGCAIACEAERQELLATAPLPPPSSPRTGRPHLLQSSSAPTLPLEALKSERRPASAATSSRRVVDNG